MHPTLNIAINAARQAGDIIMRNHQQLDRIKVASKSEHDFVSEVDIKAEQAIIQTLSKSFPEHGFIAEESGTQNEDADAVWIIDPLDGTSNYLHGYPFFAVSIALKMKGRIEHGVIYDPLRQEFFTASRGEGARLNDRRIRVSKQTQLQGAMLATGFPVRYPEVAKRYLPTFEAMFSQCAGIRRSGSAALDLCYVACGRVDGFWEMGLRPWDVAAASLIIKEAGGFVSDCDGTENYLKTGNIVAASPKLFKELLQTVNKALPKS